MTEISEIPTIHKPELEYSSILGDKRIVISTTENTLRKNLIQAALSNGTTEDKAVKAAENIRFGLGTWAEYVSKNSEIPKVLKPLVKNLKGGTLGFVNFSSNPVDCYINIDSVIEAVTRGHGVPNFKIPKYMSEEARQGAVIQAVDAVWKHEREHLIQGMNKQELDDIKKSGKTVSIVAKIALGTLAIGTPLMLYGMNLHGAEGAYFVIASSAAIAGTGFATTIASELKNHHTKHEKDAYNKMTHGDLRSSPFVFRIEDNKD